MNYKLMEEIRDAGFGNYTNEPINKKKEFKKGLENLIDFGTEETAKLLSISILWTSIILIFYFIVNWNEFYL